MFLVVVMLTLSSCRYFSLSIQLEEVTEIHELVEPQ